MRRDAREAVYKILYAENFNDYTDDEFKHEIYSEQKLTNDDAAFADKLLDAIRKNRDEIN